MKFQEQKAVALYLVEKVGKEFANKSRKSYWAFEDHHRAARYEAQLPILRDCWKKLKSAQNNREAANAVSAAENTINDTSLRLARLFLVNRLNWHPSVSPYVYGPFQE